MKLDYWPIAAALGFGLAAAAAIYLWRRKKPTPAELEKRRRTMVEQVGKMGDATVVEIHDSLISYRYHVRGIEYQATQDLDGMTLALSPEQWGTIEAVSVKFDPRNPANSIIHAEKWSGLPKSMHSDRKQDKHEN